MSIDIRRALDYMKQDISSGDFSKLKFDYEIADEGKRSTASANLTLGGTASVYVFFNAYPGGGAWFRAVFDKIEKSPAVLSLINDFNDDNLFFKAYVTEKGYLELDHFFVADTEDTYRYYAGEFLSRLAKLASHETLKKLTDLTHK